MVSGLPDAECEKCHKNCIQRLDERLENSPKTVIWRNQKNLKIC